MSERSINLASAIGALLILLPTLALAAALALFVGGCTTTPPGPVIPDPPPNPTPAATCSTACANAVRLKCTTDEPLCNEACARYEQLGGDSAWPTSCLTAALSCVELDACRSSQ